jgi:hypothetical protein
VRYRKRVRVLVVRARVLAAGLCLVVICVGRVFAEAPDTVLLEELTWTEVRDLVGAKTTTSSCRSARPSRTAPT